jgi:hypothetical protein
MTRERRTACLSSEAGDQAAPHFFRVLSAYSLRAVGRLGPLRCRDRRRAAARDDAGESNAVCAGRGNLWLLTTCRHILPARARVQVRGDVLDDTTTSVRLQQETQTVVSAIVPWRVCVLRDSAIALVAELSRSRPVRLRPCHGAVASLPVRATLGVSGMPAATGRRRGTGESLVIQRRRPTFPGILEQNLQKAALIISSGALGVRATGGAEGIGRAAGPGAVQVDFASQSSAYSHPRSLPLLQRAPASSQLPTRPNRLVRAFSRGGGLRPSPR